MYSSGLSLGYGATQASQPESTQTRAPKQEEKATCIPVTVRVLQHALAARADHDAELQIHGTEFGSVVLVGTVEDLVMQTAVVEFTINDASGRMKVRQFEAPVEGLANGCYVNVVGSLRTAPAVHVSAMALRMVQSADEVSYHMIETAHAALKLRNGGSASVLPTAQTAMTPGPKQRATDLLTPTKEATDAPMMPVEAMAPPAAEPAAPAQMQSAAKKVMELDGAQLRAAVVKVLETGDSTTGLNMSVVHQKLECAVTMERVRATISQLVDDGEAFSTIDDDHHALV